MSSALYSSISRSRFAALSASTTPRLRLAAATSSLPATRKLLAPLSGFARLQSTITDRGVVPSLLASNRPTALRLAQTSSVILPQTMAPARRKHKLPEGYVEDMSKGNMLRFEDSLPRLPIPTLEETAKRYLKSVHPLLTASEYKDTERAMQDFVRPGGPGEKLQERLIARRDDPKIKNWIAEWWNNDAYLADSGPVVPYVSYFYSHRDDRQRRDPAKRAAAITTAALEFKKAVDHGTLEPEYMRKVPVAMNSFWWMFNCCRIPARPADYPLKYNFQEHPYIIVMRKNQFFKVFHEHDGKQLNTAELEAQFRNVLERAERSPAVGVMTAERRGEWTKMRETLLNANPVNRASVEAIEAASFVICFDDAAPVTLEERAHQYWHGDGCNRWMDKPLTWIINDNGTAGFMGEHSMMDGTATTHLNEFVCDQVFNNKLDFNNPNIRSDLPDPQPLKFVVTPDVQKAISSAQAFHETTMAMHELSVLAYQGYGKGMIKKFKCSPDGFVQMVIQLAYHKMYGKNRPTYESAQTRKFQQGRTEAARSVSDESVAFCDAMADPSVPDNQRVELFRAALKSQGQYITDALDGHGVDRHLFGLKKLIKEGEEVPALYKDPAYAYSSTWRISSSQLSSEYFNGYGWSQVVDDGWGIAYMINENSLQFNIVSKGLGTPRMSFYLSEAASDLRDLMTPTMESKPKL